MKDTKLNKLPQVRKSKTKNKSVFPTVRNIDTPATNNDAVDLLKKELEEKITSLTDDKRQLIKKIFDLYTIFEISRNFNAVLDYNQLLDTFLYTALAQAGASKAAIYLKKNHYDKYYVIVQQKGSSSFPDKNLSLKGDSTMIEYITKLNRPVISDDLMKNIANDDEQKIIKKFHPGLVVPMIYQTRLSGILLISEKISNREFSLDDIEFLSILGNQISVAIENTRLYEAEKLTSQQLRSTQQQLVHSERLAALGEMSAKVAHEINNPLGIIKNYIQLLKQVIGKNEKAKDYAEIVRQEIDRIARIVKELLDFHRPKGFEFQKVDIARVLGDVFLLMERQLETNNIKLIKKFEPNCPAIKVSPENLKQVFLNIIINACDVMNDGGTLEVNINHDKQYVLIRFSDTGPGILPENVPRIFEPFFTTKKQGKGTGLGLSVCYGIIKKHKGTITYKNLDSGGCFEIKLPKK